MLTQYSQSMPEEFERSYIYDLTMANLINIVRDWCYELGTEPFFSKTKRGYRVWICDACLHIYRKDSWKEIKLLRDIIRREGDLGPCSRVRRPKAASRSSRAIELSPYHQKPNSRSKLPNTRQSNTMRSNTRQYGAVLFNSRQHDSGSSNPRQHATPHFNSKQYDISSSSSRQYNASSSGSRQCDAVSSSSRQCDSVSSNSRQYDSVSFYSRQCDAASSSSVQHGSVFSNPRQYDVVSSNSRQYDAASSSSGQYDSVSFNSRQYDAASSSLGQHDSVSSNSGQYDAVSFSSCQHDSVSSNSRQYDAVSSSSGQYDGVSSNSRQSDLSPSNSRNFDTSSSNSRQSDIAHSSPKHSDTNSPNTSQCHTVVSSLRQSDSGASSTISFSTISSPNTIRRYSSNNKSAVISPQIKPHIFDPLNVMFDEQSTLVFLSRSRKSVFYDIIEPFLPFTIASVSSNQTFVSIELTLAQSDLDFLSRRQDGTIPGIKLFCFPFKQMEKVEQDSTGTLAVEFPEKSDVLVNGKSIRANLKGKKHCPGTSRVPDVHDHIVKAKGVTNRIDLYYESSEKFLLVAQKILFTPINILVDRVISAKTTDSSDLQTFRKDEDDLITTIELSLKCPLGFGRIVNPFRSIRCIHAQCFDGTTFFRMNEQMEIWECPICQIKLDPFFDIIQDKFFLGILNSAPKEVDRVLVNSDGTWHAKAFVSNSARSLNHENNFIDLSDTSCPDPPSNAVVDLTLSDDDLAPTVDTRPVLRTPTARSSEATFYRIMLD